MAGHSKWANIKHKKGAEDAKRSKIFQKFSTEILVAVKEGGNNVDTNNKLRLAIEKAKSGNMPNDNIKRLLEKTDKGGANFMELNYEGYGPSGIAILIKCLTDNVNRTASSIKSIFTKAGGNLGTTGSVSYLFETKGILVLDSSNYSIDKIMEHALEMDIIDLRQDGDVIVVETDPSKFIEVKESLEKKGIDDFLSSEVTKIASSTIELDDSTNEKLQKLIETLEDDDDVQDVYTNAN